MVDYSSCSLNKSDTFVISLSPELQLTFVAPLFKFVNEDLLQSIPTTYLATSSYDHHIGIVFIFSYHYTNIYLGQGACACYPRSPFPQFREALH